MVIDELGHRRAELTEDEAPILGHLVAVANRLAREAGISEKGYRLVVNCGPDGGQVVPHLHLHLLGRRPDGQAGLTRLWTRNKS